jgi:hypothetical protein
MLKLMDIEQNIPINIILPPVFILMPIGKYIFTLRGTTGECPSPCPGTYDLD